MHHSKFVIRSILSTAVAALLSVSAHAEETSPYIELYKNQVNSTSQVPSARIATQQTINKSTVSATSDNSNMPANSAHNATNVAIQPLSHPTAAPNQTDPAANRLAINPAQARTVSPVNNTNTAPRNNIPSNSNNLNNSNNVINVMRQNTTGRLGGVTNSSRSTQSAQSVIPTVDISNVSFVSTVIIPVSSYGNDKIDVSLLDEFIKELSPHARHYPPNFNTPSDRYYSSQKLEQLEEWLRPYAERPDASYEVLLRAAKLNGMARNLDFGSDYAVRGSNYIARALQQQPNSQEANFLYGMMLAEGGGFSEGEKYLSKAAGLGYAEAEQSLAQSDLLSDRRNEALARLQRLQQNNPNNETIRKQIEMIQNGEYYIWNLDN